ncbi:MAG: FAD:protein FMN transferase [Gammaproteobacteria bacterium]|nr:FAD:protein FMN transferase [Gammaproteobacteria bacterium]
MPQTSDLITRDDYFIGRFTAMACPCEILISTNDKKTAIHALEIAQAEATRIEQKFSRYRKDNIIFKINNSNGTTIEVDEETAGMLDFANQCYELSDKKFDITSGVLREIWKFDGSNNIPSKQQVMDILPRIGWNKITWENPFITLQRGMEIDLGGIGKEYAVDQTTQIIHKTITDSVLVNFGGDIATLSPRKNNTPWLIGVDDPENTGRNALGQIPLLRGGLATSGDARRYLLKDGIRYSHILDPTTGWPVPDAPRSVTVVANTCLEAGMLSTFAMLEGNKAKEFLQAQDVQFWCA